MVHPVTPAPQSVLKKKTWRHDSSYTVAGEDMKNLSCDINTDMFFFGKIVLLSFSDVFRYRFQ